MNKKAMGLLGSTALVTAVSVVGVAAPSQADLVTHCVGTGGAVTVPGDLVVPEGESCVLDGTTVSGNIEVHPSANLIADDVNVSGSITVSDDAYVETQRSNVAGNITLTDAFGSRLEGSGIAGDVLTKSDEQGASGFVFVFNSEVAADVTSRDGEMMLDGAEISGDVLSQHSLYTEVHESFIDGKLVVDKNEQRSTICGAVVQGSGNITANSGLVQLGSDGPATECAYQNYWGGALAVTDNADSVFVDQNTVNDSVLFEDNSPVVLFGEYNMVRGQINGDYEDWDGSESDSSRKAVLKAEPMSRVESLNNRSGARRHDAQDRAAQAGDAELVG